MAKAKNTEQNKGNKPAKPPAPVAQAETAPEVDLAPGLGDRGADQIVRTMSTHSHPLAHPSHNPALSANDRIAKDAAELSRQLSVLRDRLFAPSAKKQMRPLSSTEAAKLIGVSDSYLRQLSIGGDGPQPEVGAGGRRYYTLDNVHALRDYLASQPKSRGKVSSPRRRAGEKLQVIAVTNFKGGSGKTTTSVHLAQYLAMQGYRTLAVDLDPQASLSALLGYQPELDVERNATFYGAIRYDEERVPLKNLIAKTYFAGLDLVPGNLELHEFEHTTPQALAARTKGSEMFFARVGSALVQVDEGYDVVVIDCPPQLGFLTLGALCAATSVLVTVHPQMLDVASMSQFLLMTSDLLSVVEDAGAQMQFDFLRYCVTRYEPNDGPQTQIVGFLRSLFGARVLTNTMLKSTAISDAGLTKQTLYEVGRENFTRSTYDRAIEALDGVNGEVEDLILQSWGREQLAKRRAGK